MSLLIFVANSSSAATSFDDERKQMPEHFVCFWSRFFCWHSIDEASKFYRRINWLLLKSAWTHVTIQSTESIMKFRKFFTDFQSIVRRLLSPIDFPTFSLCSTMSNARETEQRKRQRCWRDLFSYAIRNRYWIEAVKNNENGQISMLARVCMLLVKVIFDKEENEKIRFFLVSHLLS